MNSWNAINLANAAELDRLFAKYLENRANVDPSLAFFFDGLTFAEREEGGVSAEKAPEGLLRKLLLEEAINKGHLEADINPLASKKFNGSYLGEITPTSDAAPFAKELIEAFAGKIGFEIGYIHEPKEREFLIQKALAFGKFTLTESQKERALSILLETSSFEGYLHRAFQGQKRFSIEGGEGLLLLLNEILAALAKKPKAHLVMGMAHRGRLSTLALFLGKPMEELFYEFSAAYAPPFANGYSGDVKYHLGTHSEKKIDDSSVKLTLLPNPSHLEAVDPVVIGYARALEKDGGDQNAILPLLIHGDAAFAGQGVVYETLQLSGLEGFSAGGSIHIIVNNQIGFTARPEESRSTRYATDLAKSFSIPVLHLNGNDPAALIFAAAMAEEYRALFHKSIILDMQCYRKYGHNESDEPAFTQPKMYEAIRARKSVGEELAIAMGLSPQKIEEITAPFQARFEAAFAATQKGPKSLEAPVATSFPKTALPKEQIDELLLDLAKKPEGRAIHPRLEKAFEERGRSPEKIDFAMGELLAYGSLLKSGYSIRLSGQDARRGTFSHRHAFYIDPESEISWSPLSAMAKNGAHLEVVNSFLSEEAVLAFEYGYSVASPTTLTIWEAQFGDFANSAQVVIDQFIATAASKWNQQSGLVLFLPHGQEGQGPEHSSARLERFLSLSANHNWEVSQASTPAQLFFRLRAQALSEKKSPLVLMTPKSLLRNAQSFSPRALLSEGEFYPILEDPRTPYGAKRLVLMSGKFFYELESARGEAEVALLRIERLYPFPEESFKELLSRYPKITHCVFTQEEPINQGAAPTLLPILRRLLPQEITFEIVARDELAAPAIGYPTLFKEQQKELIERALGRKNGSL